MTEPLHYQAVARPEPAALLRRLAVAFTGFYDHENGVVPDPTPESLLWAEDLAQIVARAGLTFVEADTGCTPNPEYDDERCVEHGYLIVLPGQESK